VPRSVLAYHRASFPLFSEKGKQFYLPAFLLDALDNLCDTREQIVFCLTPQAGITWPYRDDALYTEAQRDVIRRFLKYVRDEGNDAHLAHYARVALDLVWARKTP